MDWPNAVLGLCHWIDWVLQRGDADIGETNRLNARHNLDFINISFKQLALDITGRDSFILRVLKEVGGIVWSQHFWCFKPFFFLFIFHKHIVEIVSMSFFFNNRFYSLNVHRIVCLLPPLLRSNLSFQLISLVFR